MQRTLLPVTRLRLAALAAAMVLAAPAAHAFTYETKSYTDDSTLPPGYTDPDKKVEQFNSGNVATPPPGGTTFHFSVGPSNDGLGAPANGRFGPAGQYIPMPGMQTFPGNR
jgi:hypothetical protein